MKTIHQERPRKIVFMVKRGVDSEFVVVAPEWEKKTEE
jgi:hypothetical protein